MTYPNWIREPILEMYQQGLSSPQIELLTGIQNQTVGRWCESAGIMRSYSEARMGNQYAWKGDAVGYKGQHNRAMKDFPDPLGECQIPNCENPATDRARIDHSNLPYRKEYVALWCRSCNAKHDLFNHEGPIDGGFIILFNEVS